MINSYTTDIDRIREALLEGSVGDVELIGNAVTALTRIIQMQQQSIEKLKAEVTELKQQLNA